ARKQTHFRTGQTLKEYLKTLLQRQYFPARTIYNPPDHGLGQSYYVSLGQEPAVLRLADGVKAFTVSEETLALGLENGNVHVFGDFPCGLVTLPEEGPVGPLSHHAQSPYLAAAVKDGKKVYVFDLRRCGYVMTHEAKGALGAVAISPKGTWLALVDGTGRIMVGPPLGELSRVTLETGEPVALRNKCLALAFTPQEGLLMAVDAGGWITFWAPRKHALVDRFRIPGGPFGKAAFEGRFLTCSTPGGRLVTHDLATRKKTTPRKQNPLFSLDEGILYYRTVHSRWVKKMHFGRPKITVLASRESHLFKVLDVDGQARFYGITDGTLTKPAPGKDWRVLEIDPEGCFRYKGILYRLADPAYFSDDKTLLCRYVPDKGFFVWWVESFQSPDAHPRTNALPLRENLRSDAPLTWVSLEPPKNLP
ncbi:MAG: hypothetical protein SVS15_11405, partial [Thermodesulfobacteriota bacterium]|nr:hypothetical protein [Thermodesulfobacteriota bacterium]